MGGDNPVVDRQDQPEEEKDFASDTSISPSGGRTDVPKPTDPSEDDATDVVGQTGEPKSDV